MSLQINANGRTYDGIDAKIHLLGNEAREISGAAYGFARDHQNNYGLGSDEPTSYSMGVKQYEEGSMTMSMREVVAMENAAGDSKDITRMKPFATIFTYLNDNDEIVQDKVVWKFTNWGRELNIDDLGTGKEFTMHIISISRVQ